VKVEKTFDCSLDTIREIRRWIKDVLAAYKTPEDVIDDVILAASEAVTNAIVHGYSDTRHGRIDARVQFSDEAITLVVRDYGSGFRKKQYMAPDTSTPHEGGYGVYLMQTLMDEVEVVPLGEGTEIRMMKTIRSGRTT
jgi:anti-sigma regulatory factor (Ser/Thr protein kinase)